MGSHQIDAGAGGQARLRCELVEALAGQNDEIGRLACAQAIKQRERRRKVGIDQKSRRRFELPGQALHRAPHGERRQ